jgi:hypothetical protein
MKVSILLFVGVVIIIAGLAWFSPIFRKKDETSLSTSGGSFWPSWSLWSSGSSLWPSGSSLWPSGSSLWPWLSPKKEGFAQLFGNTLNTKLIENYNSSLYRIFPYPNANANPNYPVTPYIPTQHIDYDISTFYSRFKSLVEQAKESPMVKTSASYWTPCLPYYTELFDNLFVGSNNSIWNTFVNTKVLQLSKVPNTGPGPWLGRYYDWGVQWESHRPSACRHSYIDIGMGGFLVSEGKWGHPNPRIEIHKASPNIKASYLVSQTDFFSVIADVLQILETIAPNDANNNNYYAAFFNRAYILVWYGTVQDTRDCWLWSPSENYAGDIYYRSWAFPLGTANYYTIPDVNTYLKNNMLVEMSNYLQYPKLDYLQTLATPGLQELFSLMPGSNIFNLPWSNVCQPTGPITNFSRSEALTAGQLGYFIHVEDGNYISRWLRVDLYSLKPYYNLDGKYQEEIVQNLNMSISTSLTLQNVTQTGGTINANTSISMTTDSAGNSFYQMTPTQYNRSIDTPLTNTAFGLMPYPMHAYVQEYIYNRGTRVAAYLQTTTKNYFTSRRNVIAEATGWGFNYSHGPLKDDYGGDIEDGGNWNGNWFTAATGYSGYNLPMYASSYYSGKAWAYMVNIFQNYGGIPGDKLSLSFNQACDYYGSNQTKMWLSNNGVPEELISTWTSENGLRIPPMKKPEAQPTIFSQLLTASTVGFSMGKISTYKKNLSNLCDNISQKYYEYNGGNSQIGYIYDILPIGVSILDVRADINNKSNVDLVMLDSLNLFVQQDTLTLLTYYKSNAYPEVNSMAKCAYQLVVQNSNFYATGNYDATCTNLTTTYPLPYIAIAGPALPNATITNDMATSILYYYLKNSNFDAAFDSPYTSKLFSNTLQAQIYKYMFKAGSNIPPNSPLLTSTFMGNIAGVQNLVQNRVDLGLQGPDISGQSFRIFLEPTDNNAGYYSLYMLDAGEISSMAITASNDASNLAKSAYTAARSVLGRAQSELPTTPVPATHPRRVAYNTALAAFNIASNIYFTTGILEGEKAYNNVINMQSQTPQSIIDGAKSASNDIIRTASAAASAAVTALNAPLLATARAAVAASAGALSAVEGAEARAAAQAEEAGRAAGVAALGQAEEAYNKYIKTNIVSSPEYKFNSNAYKISAIGMGPYDAQSFIRTNAGFSYTRSGQDPGIINMSPSTRYTLDPLKPMSAEPNFIIGKILGVSRRIEQAWKSFTWEMSGDYIENITDPRVLNAFSNFNKDSTTGSVVQPGYYSTSNGNYINDIRVTYLRGVADLGNSNYAVAWTQEEYDVGTNSPLHDPINLAAVFSYVADYTTWGRPNTLWDIGGDIKYPETTTNGFKFQMDSELPQLTMFNPPIKLPAKYVNELYLDSQNGSCPSVFCSDSSTLNSLVDQYNTSLTWIDPFNLFSGPVAYVDPVTNSNYEYTYGSTKILRVNRAFTTNAAQCDIDVDVEVGVGEPIKTDTNKFRLSYPEYALSNMKIMMNVALNPNNCTYTLVSTSNSYAFSNNSNMTIEQSQSLNEDVPLFVTPYYYIPNVLSSFQSNVVNLLGDATNYMSNLLPSYKTDIVSYRQQSVAAAGLLSEINFSNCSKLPTILASNVNVMNYFAFTQNQRLFAGDQRLAMINRANQVNSMTIDYVVQITDVELYNKAPRDVAFSGKTVAYRVIFQADSNCMLSIRDIVPIDPFPSYTQIKNMRIMPNTANSNVVEINYLYPYFFYVDCTSKKAISEIMNSYPPATPNTYIHDFFPGDTTKPSFRNVALKSVVTSNITPSKCYAEGWEICTANMDGSPVGNNWKFSQRQYSFMFDISGGYQIMRVKPLNIFDTINNVELTIYNYQPIPANYGYSHIGWNPNMYRIPYKYVGPAGSNSYNAGNSILNSLTPMNLMDAVITANTSCPLNCDVITLPFSNYGSQKINSNTCQFTMSDLPLANGADKINIQVTFDRQCGGQQFTYAPSGKPATTLTQTVAGFQNFQNKSGFLALRFTPTRVRSSYETAVDIGKLVFFNGGRMLKLNGVAENPNYTDRFSSANLINYKNNELYYYDILRTAVVVIKLDGAPAIDGFCIITSPNNTPTRDPVCWKLEGKTEDGWRILHEQKLEYKTPQGRFATTELFSLTDAASKVIKNPLGQIRKKAVATDRSFFNEKGTASVEPILMDVVTADIPEKRRGHRYIRFRTIATRFPSAEGVQLSRILFFKAGVQLSFPTGTRVSNPMGVTKTGCTADNVLTGTPGSYWFDLNKYALIYQFPEPLSFDSYALITAPTDSGKDPVRWKLESSHNGTFWQIIDDQSLPFPVPSERLAITKKIIV